MSLLKYYQKLDDAVSYLLSSSISEKKLLKQFFNKKEITYVDIGTNIGNYLEFVKRNLNTKKVFCFEPIKSLNQEFNSYLNNQLYNQFLFRHPYLIFVYRLFYQELA